VSDLWRRLDRAADAETSRRDPGPPPPPPPTPDPDSNPDPVPDPDPPPPLLDDPPPPPPPPPPGDTPRLVIDGPRAVVSNLDAGREVTEIAFDVDQITVGCTDIYESHYPDIDLLMYRGNDPYISRKHARFLREGNEHFIQVLTDADSTTFNNSEDVITQNERRKLAPGDTVYFSHSLAIRFER
jgi:pSer/pThr/pTyr-binding forkhead associated (FHA) protein